MPSKHRVGGSNPSGQATFASVVKLVDTRDLKSLALGHPGSSPGVRTKTSLHVVVGRVATTQGCSMARTKKKAAAAPMRAQTIEEWLAQGNKITICPPGMRSEDIKEKFNPKRRGRRSAKKKTD